MIPEPKVALVTGGAARFGLAITQQFLASSVRVVIFDLNLPQEGLFSTTDNVKVHKGDVTKREDWDQAVTLAKDTWGRIDIVVVSGFYRFSSMMTQYIP